MTITSSTPIRVLVVDDHEANRALAQATLEDEGYEVKLAADGAAGIAAFEHFHPACILLDVRMPGLDGIATCERIRALPGGDSVAIVFVTAEHDVETFDRAVAAGGDDFMTKPYRPSELALRVRTALRLRQTANERDELFALIKQPREDLQRIQLQMRDANEKLILASVQADEATDAANAARAAATLSELRFRTLVATASAFVWRATADGRVRFEAESWRSFTGLDDSDVGGWGWLDAVHPQDRVRVHAAWSLAIATTTAYICEHRLMKRDGGYAWVVAKAAPVRSPGAELEWIGMVADVSDRVRVEEARERFIGILGHDLRNPLGAIMMGVELLGDLTDPERSVVARIDRSAHRMEAMIRDVLDFARGRLGDGIPIAPIATDLGKVGRDVIEEMRQAFPTREITVAATGELGGRWDADRVEQVLSNLLGNAIKHGTGPIAVAMRDTGDAVTMIVHNGGSAIPPALIPLIFDPFRSEHARAEGLGLGLYIASEIVRAHAGTIHVTSTEEDGTTFTIRWPRTKSRVPALELDVEPPHGTTPALRQRP